MSDPRWVPLILELRRAGITDAKVLRALEQVPRERFVAPGSEDVAFENRALPIACEQTISQPLVVAAMTQALALEPHHKVLEIGTGSGYQAAILALLCRRLYTIERHRDLHTAAHALLRALKYRNITTLLGDGWRGWPEQAPFDRIMVTAAPDEIPQALVEQLAPGGVMVLPLGKRFDAQDLVRLTKDETGAIHTEVLMPVKFVPMERGLAPAAR